MPCARCRAFAGLSQAAGGSDRLGAADVVDRRQHVDGGAVAEGGVAGDDHVVAGIDAVEDLHARSVLVAEADRRAHGLAVADDVGDGRIATAEHSRLRHQQRVLQVQEGDVHARAQAGAQGEVAVVDAHDDADRAAVAVDHRCHALDACAEPAGAEGIDGEAHRLAGGEGDGVALRHAQVGAQVGEIGHVEHRRIRDQQLAALDPATGDDAVERRADLALADVDAGEVDFGATHGVLRGGLVVHGRRDQAAGEQLLAAIDLVAAALQVGLGFAQLQAAAVGVEAGEQLALAHALAFLDDDLGTVPGTSATSLASRSASSVAVAA